MKPRVAILDAGAQYVDLILKACERQGFPSQIFPINTPFDSLPQSIEAIVVSGGPSSSHAQDAPMPDTKFWHQANIPTFNICYGMQAFALATGGKVTTRGYREDGRHLTSVKTDHPLFTKIREQTQALFTHGDFVDAVGNGVSIIGSHETENGHTVISAIAQGPHVCVQFHPEVTDDTPQGYEIFSNFFEFVAKIKPDVEFLKNRMKKQISDKQKLIKNRMNGDKHMIAFVSGGVDSVTAVMLAKDVVSADKLHMYYIDNGFMRDEDDSVIESLRNVGLDVHKIDAEKRFEDATALIDHVKVGPLKNTVNPVHKRRIIGEAFVDIQDDIVADLGLKQNLVVLLQGTNAADRIESGHSKGGGSTTDQIKEHHNQVQRVRDLNPIEPLDDLFKEEIRALAVALGLPNEIAYRQPFPGPGLAVRILGLDENGYDIRDAKHQSSLTSAIKSLNQRYDAKLHGILLPVRSVGVGGDSRSHIQAVAIEGDVRLADLPNISSALTNEFRSLANRVVYKLAGSDLETISPVQTHLTGDMRATLRQADAIAMEVMREFKIGREIEQFPVILLPIGEGGKRSIVLRPLFTRAHLTVQALVPELHLPKAFFDQITNRILSEVDGISHVFTDLTNKPPGTTEWE